MKFLSFLFAAKSNHFKTTTGNLSPALKKWFIQGIKVIQASKSSCHLLNNLIEVMQCCVYFQITTEKCCLSSVCQPIRSLVARKIILFETSSSRKFSQKPLRKKILHFGLTRTWISTHKLGGPIFTRWLHYHEFINVFSSRFLSQELELTEYLGNRIELFSFECRKTKPKVITLTNTKLHRKSIEPIKAGFGFTPDWMRKWREIFKPCNHKA